MAHCIENVRNGALLVSAGHPLGIIAAHRDEGGTFLPTGITVIELINILRPVVAMARYIVFAAIEPHRNEN